MVSEVHTQVTVPLFGYTCLDEYYKDSCNNGKVHKIEAPLVCLTAADDPFVPKDSEIYNVINLCVEMAFFFQKCDHFNLIDTKSISKHAYSCLILYCSLIYIFAKINWYIWLQVCQ